MKVFKLAIQLVWFFCSTQTLGHGFGHHHEMTDYAKKFSAGNKDFRSGNIERIYRGEGKVVITIDDGPTPGVTEKVLDSLKANNAQATFFVIGEKAKRYPKLMKRILDEGHIVGNHTMTHPHVADIFFIGFKKKVKAEILGAHELLKPYLGNNKRFYFRAPGASWKAKAAKVLNKTEVGKKYYGPLLWDIGGEMLKDDNGKILQAADWACWSWGWSIDDCADGYVNETEEKNGGVILFHDLRKQSAAMIEKVLPRLKEKGFEFVSLDDVEIPGY